MSKPTLEARTPKQNRAKDCEGKGSGCRGHFGCAFVMTLAGFYAPSGHMNNVLGFVKAKSEDFKANLALRLAGWRRPGHRLGLGIGKVALPGSTS